MADNTESQDVRWEVLSIVPTVSVAAGKPQDGHVATVRTAMGNQTEVFIPNTVTEPGAAKELIRARVRYIDAIAQSTGT